MLSMLMLACLQVTSSGVAGKLTSIALGQEWTFTVERAAQLDALYADHWPWILSLKHDPEWDPLRTHPRFERLMARLDEHDTGRTARLASTAQR